MLKKLFIFFVLIFIYSPLSIYAGDSWTDFVNSSSIEQTKLDQAIIYNNLSNAQKESLKEEFNLNDDQLKANLSDWKNWLITESARTMTAEAASAWSVASCDWPNCITSTNFIVPVKTITPTNSSNIDDAGWLATGQLLLQKAIDILMVPFWILSLFIMTIGGWYMIMFHGQDELLSKWKSIFTSGLIWLAVALSAWLLINLVIYLLY